MMALPPGPDDVMAIRVERPIIVDWKVCLSPWIVPFLAQSRGEKTEKGRVR